jgi:hypothetical protein
MLRLPWLMLSVLCLLHRPGAAQRPVSLHAHALRHYERLPVVVLEPESGAPRALAEGEHHTRVRPNVHSRAARFAFRSHGRDFDVVLHINDDLIGKKFVHLATGKNGTEHTVIQREEVDHCYYVGGLSNEPSPRTRAAAGWRRASAPSSGSTSW